MKKLLTIDELESQVALELPERQMVTWYRITILDVNLNKLVEVDVDVSDINVALAVCAGLLQKFQDFGANACRIQQH